MTNGTGATITLTPDRNCGGCMVCCKELSIDSAGLTKPPGVLCRHAREGCGCTIYSERPPVCRDWYCVWRFAPAADMGEEWRPDRCGILVTLTAKNIPEGFGDRALQFCILSGGSHRPDAALSWEPFLRMISHCADANQPMFLVLQARPGSKPKACFLNHHLRNVKDRSQLIELLSEVYRLGTAPAGT